MTGIIHVGAHKAEEANYYHVPTIWIEADPELYAELRDKGLRVHHFAATNYKGKARFNVMPFKAANSLLEPNLNKRRPDVYIEKRIEVPAGMIKDIQEDGFNFLALDIQGAEKWALMGTDLSKIDYIQTEVHKVDTYHECTQIDWLDDYLKDFKRALTKWTRYGWGEALYTRR